MPLLACSSNKREDSAMPQPVKQSDSGSSSSGSGSGSATPAAQPMVYLTTPAGDIPVKVEVVATERAIEQGLMYRESLPIDSGMLFLMGREYQWSFWMRNTLIPLDMIFISRDMTIAGIVENAEPLTESLRQVDKPSSYVLEVNGGFTRKAGVVAGAKVRFENVAQ
jgi:uncharacterized membrane protein (UPF0127 family)